MNTQFKKGVLELVVLLTISKDDKYGYELVNDVSGIIDVNEGTIYPLLKRLTNDRYLETYLQESTEGPPRKYYHLTKNGQIYMQNLLAEWITFVKDVNTFIEKEKFHE